MSGPFTSISAWAERGIGGVAAGVETAFPRPVAMPGYAADDFETIRARKAEIEREEQDELCSCQRSMGGARIATNPHCIIHGTSPAEGA